MEGNFVRNMEELEGVWGIYDNLSLYTGMNS